MTTGEKIRKARTAVGITQKGLAQRVGVSEQAVGRWKSGWRNPSEESLRRICEALRIKPESLLPDDCAVCRQAEMKPTIPERPKSRPTELTITSRYEIDLIESYRKMTTLHQEELLDVAIAFANQ